MTRDSYTRYPRPILWLVRGGRGIEPFYLSKLPVTNRQYEAFAPRFRREAISPEDDDPAVGVSYEDAAGYCAWYARVSNKAMRLPTEAEWEYACRAGMESRWFFGDDPAAADTYVWHEGNSGACVPPLADKRPNPFGLVSMLGGVWEWTAARVLRGGSFRVPLSQIAPTLRRGAAPDQRFDDAGFRLARAFRTP